VNTVRLIDRSAGVWRQPRWRHAPAGRWRHHSVLLVQLLRQQSAATWLAPCRHAGAECRSLRR